MKHDRTADRVDALWAEATDTVGDLGPDRAERLAIAISGLDALWDRQIFRSATTFGGPEIGFARMVSAALLARLLDVPWAALPSVGASDLPTTGNDELDAGLVEACREALDTCTDELLGPVELAGHLVYAKPVLVDSPLPIGAAILAARTELTAADQRLLDGFLQHFDTRLDVAERLLSLRRETETLSFELRRATGQLPTAPAQAQVRTSSGTDDVVWAATDVAEATPMLDVFGVKLPSEHFGTLCHDLQEITRTYLSILEQAPELYLDVPSGVDAKSDHRMAAPYARLLGIMDLLRQVGPRLSRLTAEDLEPFTVGGRTPTFADLTRAAAARADDETLATILDIMNDRGEEQDLDALAARRHPYEYRAANVGEVFALLALNRTATRALREESRTVDRSVVDALRGYQAARAYLFSFDRFDDVPLKGESRVQPPAADNLLFLREKAPEFGALLRAFSR
jgi:hypothetical protein